MRFRNIAVVFFSLALVAMASFAQQVSRRIPSTAEPPLVQGRNTNYGTLPLAFEANQGQTSPQAKFRAHGRGYSAYLTAGGMMLILRPTGAAAGNATDSALSNSPKQLVLRFTLLGANPSPVIAGEDQRPGHINYFIGADPAKWHRNVPIFARVRYKNIYPGIDLIYYGSHQQLEYDFALAPGADPNKIQFAISGADQILIDPEGNLVLQTGSGELHFQSPVVYQESNGRRVPVRGMYVLKDATHIAFQVAQYDATKPLVIDPVLVYSTYLGGSGDDQASGIAVDSAGNVYVAGSTDSTDFPLATPGSLSGGNAHVFIAKLDSTGSNLIYADYLGGNGQDYGYALALDSTNNVYVTGSTASSNFPTVNAFQATYPGSSNAFLTKISADGSSLLYSTYFGGNSSDVPSSVGVDAAGDMIIAGYTYSTNLPVANAYQSGVSANQGGIYGNYGFLTKFSPDGSSLVYSTYFGGSSNTALNCGGTPCWTPPTSAIAGMVLDTAGNAYVTGTTNTYDFPVTAGSYQTTNSSQPNSAVGFVSKFSSVGGLQYSTYFYDASGLFTEPTAVATDGTGSAYLTGVTFGAGTFPITSTNICDPSVYGFGCNYAFATKFDADGATLLYSTYLGPNNNAIPQAIVLDGNEDAYILGFTGTSTFTTVNGIENYSNQNDLLLVEIDPTASTQLFATYVGGSGNDQPAPAGMALDANNNIYVAGMTDSSDFPVTQGAFQSSLGGNTDAFILKIVAASAPAVALSAASLQYASQTIGSSSQPQTVLLRNMGSAPLSISSITTKGDFAETDDCGSSVAGAGSCTLSVTFTPTEPGARAGSIGLADNAAGSPHVISLSGSGLGAVVTLTPSNLSFSGTPVGASSSAQTVTLANTGNATLSISGVQIAGDYAQTNTCPTSLSPGSTCAVSVTFTPTQAGSLSGALTISDSAAGSPQSVALSGSGSDFSLAGSPSSVSVKAGATATFVLTIASAGGTFANSVKLSCAGTPAKTNCSLSPSSVTPGANPATATLTIETTAASAEMAPLRSAQTNSMYAIGIEFPGLIVFGMMLAGPKRLVKKVHVLIALILLVAALFVMSGCAGGTGITTPPQNGTAPGTYTITVTGVSGSLKHSLPVTLTVQ